MRLLLIEDDHLLGTGLRDYLDATGHSVHWCPNLAHAIAQHGEPFDAYLVDWQLPDGSGLSWLQARRRDGDMTPALVLTARDRLHERIQGLDSGADDYLVKPFAPEELAARLRAVARRTAGTPTGLWWVCTDAVVDVIGLRARRAGALVGLTAREWALLAALLQRNGRAVAKGDLEALVAGEASATALSNTLEVHVSALRRKLGPEAVRTLRGVGYRCDAQAATGWPTPERASDG